MTESMIERVAKTLCALDGHAPDAVGGDSFDDGLVHWHTYIQEARAAIEVMREPTDLMLEAIATAQSISEMEWAWTTMIDAALRWPARSADRAGVPLARD